MKKLSFLLLSILLIFFACKEEVVPIVDTELHYDTDNHSAPTLAGGEHVAAARFLSSEMGQYKGQSLKSVKFYLASPPSKLEVVVYGSGGGNKDGSILYEQEIPAADMIAHNWNEHTLTAPVGVTGEVLYIGVRISHNFQAATIGCDPGPAKTNGNLLSTNNGGWGTLGPNVNWNIRGIVGQ